MKQMTMKIRFLIALALGLMLANVNAADFVVQENGPTGTYGSINAAIAAAGNGDRIIIHPKIGGDAWVESLTIDKSLELTSAQDTVRYKIQGNIVIQAQANRIVSIISAHLTTGSISGTGSGLTTKVNIIGCIIDAAGISFNNQFEAHLVSNILNSGSITLPKGKVIGNDIKNLNRINVFSSNPNDTVYIIANKVEGITSNNNNAVLIIKNNHIVSSISSQYVKGIFHTSGLTSSNTLFIIENNLIETPKSNSTSASITNHFINTSAHALVKNNIFVGVNLSGSTNGPFISMQGGFRSYNYAHNTSWTVGQGITYLTSNPVNTDGRLNLPTPAQNGADPSFEYYDLDLTVGDAGCYGGSYTLDNYFPITGSSRVYHIDLPFGVSTTGGPVNLKADGFDR